MVSVDEAPVVPFGLKVLVYPAGNPVTASVTGSANPPLLVIATLYVVDVPAGIVRDVGLIEIARFGASTTRLAVAERTFEPLVPLTVSAYVPGGVVVVVVTASVEFHDAVPFPDAGVNEPDAPAGRPSTDSATLSAKPPDGETVTWYEALPPGATEIDAGATARA